MLEISDPTSQAATVLPQDAIATLQLCGILSAVDR
jgi:hypothetical protein